MDSLLATLGYSFHPQQAASTLWRRYRNGVSSRDHHALTCAEDRDGVTLRVPLEPKSSRDLFRLRVSPKLPEQGRFDTLFGTLNLTLSEIERGEPDPLWDSSDDICSHMEQDHADTFPLFYQMAGGAAGGNPTTISMPWIEASGFFLSCLEVPLFVPFPKRCESANSVRATLITMLRGARAANSQ